MHESLVDIGNILTKDKKNVFILFKMFFLSHKVQKKPRNCSHLYCCYSLYKYLLYKKEEERNRRENLIKNIF
jgi:Ca2+/Na+ antiporter